MIELLVVISIIGLLAAMVVGLAPVAHSTMVIHRTKTDLHQLITAIDSYKAKFGYYPPDNFDTTTGIVNPGTNQLFYELTGVMLNGSAAAPPITYIMPDGASFTPAQVESVFRRKGFANYTQGHNKVPSKNPDDPKAQNFLPSLSGSKWAHKTVAGFSMQMLVAPAEYREASNKQPDRTNTWRYVSSPDPLKLSSTTPYARHNPSSYDLWAEVWTGKELKIIGNW